MLSRTGFEFPCVESEYTYWIVSKAVYGRDLDPVTITWVAASVEDARLICSYRDVEAALLEMAGQFRFIVNGSGLTHQYHGMISCGKAHVPVSAFCSKAQASDEFREGASPQVVSATGFQGEHAVVDDDSYKLLLLTSAPHLFEICPPRKRNCPCC